MTKCIKVLGSDCCSTCSNLKSAIEKIIVDKEVDATVEKVTDIAEVMKYGVMSTPAVVIDEEVKCSGRSPSQKDIEEWLV